MVSESLRSWVGNWGSCDLDWRNFEYGVEEMGVESLIRMGWGSGRGGEYGGWWISSYSIKEMRVFWLDKRG